MFREQLLQELLVLIWTTGYNTVEEEDSRDRSEL